MDVTDIPTSKAPPGERQEDCLHCTIMLAMENWFKTHGRRAPDGQVIINVPHALGKLAECMVEHCEATNNRKDRRRAFRYAHDALDGALKSSRTGKLVAVDIPNEH